MLSIVVLSLLILLFLIILIKLLNLKKNIIISIFISFIIILFVVNLQSSIQAVIDGCKLCFKSIFPTVFPFSVICNLLIYYDGINLYSKIIGPSLCKPLGLSKNSSFALVASFICGYPLGAKYSTDLYELNSISRSEYLRLLNIATNCGPIFILGAVATSLLGNSKLGYILLIANYISPLIIGFVTKPKINTCNLSNNLTYTNNNNFGENFKNAINNAISTTLSVSGFVVLFSLLISIIKNNAITSIILTNIDNINFLPKGLLNGLLLGSIEITNGCNILASSTELGIHFKLAAISFLCSFSGISIIAQSFSFMSKHQVPIIKYSALKFLQGIISFFITFIISLLFNKSTPTSSIHTINTFKYELSLIFILLLILLVPYIIVNIKNKLFFHRS